MKLKNCSNQKILTEDLFFAKTWKEKVVGLLNEVTPRALFLTTRWGIHTKGMRFPIDCVVLDSAFHVVKICKNLLPGNAFFWNPMYKNLLELPPNTIDQTETKIGDQLEFF